MLIEEANTHFLPWDQPQSVEGFWSLHWKQNCENSEVWKKL